MKSIILPLLLILFISCKQTQKFESNIIENPSEADSTATTVKGHHSDYSYSLRQALLEPEKVTQLSFRDDSIRDENHLPAEIGKLINLRVIEINCLEKLEDLPPEIGSLTNLEKLICYNGNGCSMNITIPPSIGLLHELKEVVLYGALDYREPGQKSDPTKIKYLPDAFANLQNLEILDLGRNGLSRVPSQIASLKKLRILRLDYNNLHQIPSFISDLKNLQELSVLGNEKIRLPESLRKIQGLKVFIGNNSLKLDDQKELQKRFPNITFSFDNEYQDAGANEESTP